MGVNLALQDSFVDWIKFKVHFLTWYVLEFILLKFVVC